MLGELQPHREQPGIGGVPILPSCPFSHADGINKNHPQLWAASLINLFSHFYKNFYFFSLLKFLDIQYKYELPCRGDSLADLASSRHMMHKFLWDDGERGRKWEALQHEEQEFTYGPPNAQLSQCLRCPLTQLREFKRSLAPAPTGRGKSRLPLGWEELMVGSSCGIGRHCSPGS